LMKVKLAHLVTPVLIKVKPTVLMNVNQAHLVTPVLTKVKLAHLVTPVLMKVKLAHLVTPVLMKVKLAHLVTPVLMKVKPTHFVIIGLEEARASPPPRFREKILFGQMSSKIWAFSGKYHVKFGHFRHALCSGVLRCTYNNCAGVLRCVLWHNGCWVEVCIDDRLPVINNKLLVLQSDRSDEFWPALLEKACARFVIVCFTS